MYHHIRLFTFLSFAFHLSTFYSNSIFTEYSIAKYFAPVPLSFYVFITLTLTHRQAHTRTNSRVSFVLHSFFSDLSLLLQYYSLFFPLMGRRDGWYIHECLNRLTFEIRISFIAPFSEFSKIFFCHTFEVKLRNWRIFRNVYQKSVYFDSVSNEDGIKKWRKKTGRRTEENWKFFNFYHYIHIC